MYSRTFQVAFHFGTSTITRPLNRWGFSSKATGESNVLYIKELASEFSSCKEKKNKKREEEVRKKNRKRVISRVKLRRKYFNEKIKRERKEKREKK